ncbi:MAG: hypothetical protein V2A56_12310 [bacterium]
MNSPHRLLIAWLTLTLPMMAAFAGSNRAVAGSPDNWKLTPRQTEAGTGPTQPPSNIIVDLKIGLSALWVGSGDGIGRYIPSITSTNPASGSWFHATSAEGVGRGSTAGLAVGSVFGFGDVVWASTAFDSTIEGESYQVGGGVGYSLDRGATWTWFPQPVDADTVASYEPTTTAILNVTFDIAIQGSRVWIASFGGGLRYYDMTAVSPEWIVRPPDNLPFDAAAYRNHLAVSVTANDSTLWVGTSSGVNRSLDGGDTWQRFSFSASDTNTISGNWVTGITLQPLANGKFRVWTITRSTDVSGEYSGVSMSEDLGLTWRRVLGTPGAPITTHNIAVHDSAVYVATNNGLYKTADAGKSWGLFGPVYDPVTHDRTYLSEIYAVALDDTYLWMGGVEGLAGSSDDGNSWRLLRKAAPVGGAGEPQTYAYPNPFSPSRHGVVRMRYNLPRAGQVTVEIYDFALELLIRPLKDEWLPAGDHDAVWDGRGPGGKTIANGVYFFRVITDNRESWNKIMVLD